ELNGLSPVKYLEFLFERIPNLPIVSESALDELLPWNKKVQQRKRPIAQYLKTKTIFDYTLSTKKNWRWFLYEGKSRSGSNRFR
ncbi:transposase domain-containing protein, partial [Enterococcus italicus]|uniref:transposase domain-containing protein n=1 Tax=Enterococcus italicus TaxID=246144 RepID=UPI002073D1EA